VMGIEPAKALRPVKEANRMVPPGIPSYAMVNNSATLCTVIAQALEVLD